MHLLSPTYMSFHKLPYWVSAKSVLWRNHNNFYDCFIYSYWLMSKIMATAMSKIMQMDRWTVQWLFSFIICIYLTLACEYNSCFKTYHAFLEFYASNIVHLVNCTDCLQPLDLKDFFVLSLLINFLLSYKRV